MLLSEAFYLPGNDELSRRTAIFEECKFPVKPTFVEGKCDLQIVWISVEFRRFVRVAFIVKRIPNKMRTGY